MKKNWAENVEHIKEKEKKIKEMLTELKNNRWREALQDHNKHEKMWDILKKLKNREAKKDEGSVLKHRGKGYADDKAKANAFATEYSMISKLKVPKERRQTKKKTAKIFREREKEEREEDGGITMQEMVKALDKMDSKKAAGPDDIHPKLLKNLPEIGIEMFRKMFNKSLKEGMVPQNWRNARIIPLLKAGKDERCVQSYRPISLTSVIGKWMERVINDRLRFVLERKGFFSKCQAGFRRNRTVEDQLIRLTQEVHDGFQERKRTVMTLFDYEKAYDKVWRDGLMNKIMEAGCSSKIGRWIQSWLANRKAWVTVGNENSKKKLMREGVPQGAVLSPLLFIIYINDLNSNWPEGVSASMFADDLAVWASDRDWKEAKRKVEKATECVEQWSRKWLMKVNEGKCEAILFSKDAKDKNIDVQLKINGENIKMNRNPTFLGITYDMRLTFEEHTRRIIEKANKRMKILRAIAGINWGFDKDLLRETYTALIESILRYGAPAWTPWIGKGAWEKLEKVQREAARLMVGALRSTPIEAILAEAGLNTIKNKMETINTIAFERSMRMSKDSFRWEVASKKKRKRLKVEGWREEARKRWKEIFGDMEENIEEFPEMHKPWKERCKILFELDGKKDKNAADNKDMGEEKLRNNNIYDYVIYTDGSAEEGRMNGGAGMVVTRNGRKIEEVVKPAGKLCSSYQAEMVALYTALNWLEERDWTKARIVTDSKSSLMSLRNEADSPKNIWLSKVRRVINEIDIRRELCMTWVPSHCGIEGNEWADRAAEKGTREEQNVKWSYDCAKAKIKSVQRRMEFEHERTKAVFEGRKVKEKEERGWKREEAISYRRLRMGHSRELKSYLKRIGDREDGACRLCKEEEEDLYHVWTRCPAVMVRRGRQGELKELIENPKESLSLWNWFRGKALPLLLQQQQQQQQQQKQQQQQQQQQ